MTEISLPVQLGYFLEFTEPREPYVVCGRTYRGVDRTVAYMAGDFLERARTKTFPRAWEEYWDAEDEHGVLVDADTGLRCSAQLQELGVPNEPIYAEMVAFPPATDPFHGPHFRRIHDLTSRPLGGAHFLGHDVSSPVPTFHSYLMNPGLDRRLAGFCGFLNENALVSEREDAERLMREAHQLPYGRVPTVIEIWLVDDRRLVDDDG